MSDITNTPDITFQEFVELCDEAGIVTDNMAQMEQDFRSGKALADVTDALISSSEAHPGPFTFIEHLEGMDTNPLSSDKPADYNREHALRVAVHAIRFLAECCYDEGQN